MYERIAVGTDGSDTANAAVDHALALARISGATVHLVTAWSRVPVLALAGGVMPPVDDGSWVGPVHEAIVSRADGVKVVSHAVEAAPAVALLEVVSQVRADLLVVGNRGMTGIRGKLGSVPNTVAHKAPCAVLVVPTT